MKRFLICSAYLIVISVTPAFATAYNILDYGAIPNDGSDDTTALYLALNAANLSYGNSVYIPPGVWNIRYDESKSLRLKKNTILYGSGTESKISFDYGIISGTAYNRQLEGNFIGIEDGNGNEIHDLVFIGQGSSTQIVGSNDITVNGVMIVVWNSINTRIYNMSFLKHEGLSVLVTGNSSEFNIFDNFGWLCNFEIVQARGGARNGQIYRNVIRNAGDDAISVVWYKDDSTQPYDIEIYSNELYDCDGGINISHSKNIIVRNNFVSNSKLSGIKVTYWDRGIGDRLSPNFIPSDPSDNISIFYNQIVNCGSGGNEVESWEGSSLNAIYLYGIRNSDIHHNYIWRDVPINSNNNLQSVVIRMMDFHNVKIRNNPMHCNGFIGIGIAIYNWITTTPVNNSNVHDFYGLEISGNWIANPYDAGFSLNPPTGNTLQGVTIVNNGIIDCQGIVAGWMDNHINSTIFNNTINNGLPIIY